jgi:hypothetical protein
MVNIWFWEKFYIVLLKSNVIWLVVSTYPSEKMMELSVGMMKFPIYGRIRTCSKPPASMTILDGSTEICLGFAVLGFS